MNRLLPVLMLTCIVHPCTAADRTVPSRQPNFIFILGEGHGWSSTSVQMDDRMPGSTGNRGLTPSLERLAREGMRFSDFYAACPRCTPSRASLFTGISPARLHMTYQNEGGRERRGGRRPGEGDDEPSAAARLTPPQPITELPESVKTVGDVLRSAGYATAHFGKWHVGRVSPSRHGFDETDGPNTNVGPGDNRKPNPQEASAITDRGIAFMQRQVKTGRPFYLQLSHYGGGSEAEVMPETLRQVAARMGNARSKELCEAGIVADMDKTIGRILDEANQLGIAGNTYIIYSADHGTPGRNPPLSGGKGSVREGGLRVPFIIRGPGIAAGAISHVRAIGWDLLPTLAELAGTRQALPATVEGGSLARVLHGGGTGAVRRPEDAFVVHFPHYDLQNGGPASAIWIDNLKLIHSYETGTSSLFDLSEDRAEAHDLAGRMPDKAAAMDRRLSAYLKSVNAQMPMPNPDAQPAPPRENRREEGRKGRGRRARSADDHTRPGQVSTCTDVPAQPVNIVLGRPTRDSITASVLTSSAAEGFVEYGAQPGRYSAKTPVHSFTEGQPTELVIRGLRPDTQYYYRFESRAGRTGGFTAGPECTFRTRRPPGSTFTFTVTADSHLDSLTDCDLYARTLADALADRPDFHIDLGDTFMCDKHATREDAARQYLAQRYYLGSLACSVPLYLVLGNHDGEESRYFDGTADCLAAWSNAMRTKYFPNPVPDGFYTGNATEHRIARHLQDYYAWEWGDALLVVLDPFWFAPGQRDREDGWARSLGDEQYRWLARTLEASKARYKFVFIHNLVGGFGKDARGGAEAAGLYEWGGRDSDGTDVFHEKRPGWPMPIHDLLVRNGVSIVFHGHDHLYARQDLDQMVYQEVPQPGHPGEEVRRAPEYGYKNGVILGGSGHLRVVVSPKQAVLDYVRVSLASKTANGKTSGTVAHSYSVDPGR